jgi:hypothetical protein
VHTEFWQGNLREEDHLDGRIPSKLIKKWCEFELPEDRYRWRALVTAVMNLRFLKMLGIS